MELEEEEEEEAFKIKTWNQKNVSGRLNFLMSLSDVIKVRMTSTDDIQV